MLYAHVRSVFHIFIFYFLREGVENLGEKSSGMGLDAHMQSRIELWHACGKTVQGLSGTGFPTQYL